MAQQSANYLLKLVKKALKGKELINEQPLQYLQNINEVAALKSKATTYTDFLNIDTVEEAIQNGVCYRLINLFEAMS